MSKKEYQPKTGACCSCKRGVQRDNCPNCEGTGLVIDFKAIKNRRIDIRRDDAEPIYQHQVECDDLTSRQTYECADPTCDIKLSNHRHYIRKGE